MEGTEQTLVALVGPVQGAQLAPLVGEADVEDWPLSSWEQAWVTGQIPAIPTRGTGTGAVMGWVSAALVLGTGTRSGDEWIQAFPTRGTGTGAGHRWRR